MNAPQAAQQTSRVLGAAKAALIAVRGIRTKLRADLKPLDAATYTPTYRVAEQGRLQERSTEAAKDHLAKSGVLVAINAELGGAGAWEPLAYVQRTRPVDAQGIQLAILHALTLARTSTAALAGVLDDAIAGRDLGLLAHLTREAAFRADSGDVDARLWTHTIRQRIEALELPEAAAVTSTLDELRLVNELIEATVASLQTGDDIDLRIEASEMARREAADLDAQGKPYTLHSVGGRVSLSPTRDFATFDPLAI